MEKELKKCKSCWEYNLCCNHKNFREMIAEKEVLDLDLKYALKRVEDIKKKISERSN